MSDRWALPLLLLLTGGLIGIFAPLAKLAAVAGVPPLAYLFWLAAGSGLVLAGLTVLRGTPPPFNWHHVRYGLISGCVSFALPNLLLVWVVVHLGAGLSSIVFALPPMLTYALALGFGMERFRKLRALGILLGCAGALIILVPNQGLPSPDMIDWMLLALVIPVSLAVGNIYRTIDWPVGSPGLPLATVMMIGATLILAVAMVGLDQVYWPFALSHAGDWATVIQIAATALSYLAYFELQRRGGPVYLSQIGYVITITGVAIGVAVLGEQLTWWIWAALAVMFAGLTLVNVQQGYKTPRPER